jgi:GNAT superfamily N-acetyltransferase
MKRTKLEPGTEIEVRPLTPRDWPVIERLFGARGACGGCWCMWWRLPRGGELWKRSRGEPNKRAFKRLVGAGRVRGALAFSAGEPVGWCALGPRADFPRTERVKALRAEWDEHTWSVNCFYIPSAWRGRGVASRLLELAIEIARDGGARTLEAYPVCAKDAAGPKLAAAFAWTGVPAMFERCGFVEQPTPPASHRLHRLALTPAKRRRR